MNFFANAKEKLSNASETATARLQDEVFDQIKEKSLSKINDVWSNINDSTKTINKTGYSISEISIALALPPTINLNFCKKRDVGTEEIELLMAQNKENTIIYSILVAINKANLLQENIKSGIFEFSGLNIELGIAIPSIDLKFTKKD